MASSRPNFRDALRTSTASARGAAHRAIEGQGPKPDDKLFEKADEVMSAGGLVGKGPSQPAQPVQPTSVLRDPVTAEGPAEEDTIFNVPLEKVHDNDFNARVRYIPEVIRQRAAEIAVDGQKTPALAIPHPTIPGDYMLIEGHYRKRALLQLGRPTIKLTLRRDWTTAEHRYVQSWKANEERLANSPLDNAVQWARVLKEKVVANQEQLATLLGVSAAAVTKALALNELPQSAIERAQDKPEIFAASLLYELSLFAKCAPEDELLKLMDEVENDGLGRRSIIERRQKLEHPTKRKTREPSRQYKIQMDGVQEGSLKENDSGLIQLTVRVTDKDTATAILAQLKGVFKMEPDNQLSLR